MNLTLFFGLLGGLLVLAFIVNKFARQTGIPDVLVLMATGMVLGPIFHLVDASQFQPFARGFGTLALILILFEAGLDLDIRNTLRHFPGGIMIAVLSYAFSLVGGAFFLAHDLHLPRMTALLIAAALACISSSIMLPVLQQTNLRSSLKSILLVEASLSDALGVLTVGILLDLTSAGNTHAAPGSVFSALIQHVLSGRTGGWVAGVLAGGFLLKILISILIALLAGLLWSKFLHMLSEQRFWRVLTFAAVLLVYAAADAAGGSDLFAVIVFGVVVANFPGEARKALENPWWQLSPKSGPREELLSFHSELAFLVRSFFFVLLGLIVNFSGIRQVALPSLGLLAVLLVARWLAVQLSRFSLHDIQAREREIAVLLIPRGLITAVLAFEIIDAKPDLGFLTALAFAMILFSNLLLMVGTFRSRAIAASPSLPDEAVPGVPPSLSPTEPQTPEAYDVLSKTVDN